MSYPDPGEMTYAYIKANDSMSAKLFAETRGIDSDHIHKVSEIKPGELYMLHIQGYLSIILNWFSEPGYAPYPFGTCLLYRMN